MAGSTFESSFSQLASAKIGDQAPMLKQYRIGFQLIDNNEDETKAVGVSIFKMGDQWMYIPVFYLGGKLKGTELMYLVGQNQFVKCSENWLSYLSSQTTQKIGSPADSSEKKGPGTVSIIDSSTLPMLKMAGLDANAALKDLVSFERPEENMFDLVKWVPRLGKNACLSLLKTMESNPSFANALFEKYSPADLDRMIHKTAEMDQEVSRIAEPKIEDGSEVEVITIGSPKADTLTDKEKEVLLKDKVFIKDERKNTTTVFDSKLKSEIYETPNTPGEYTLLMADGNMKDCLVLPDLKTHAGSCGRTFYVIAAKDSNAMKISKELSGKPNFTKGFPDSKLKEYGAPAVELFDGRRARSEVLIWDKYGACISLYLEGILGSDTIDVRECGYNDKPSIKMLKKSSHDGKMYFSGNTMFIPDSARYARIDIDSYGSSSTFMDSSGITAMLHSKSGLKPLKIYFDTTEYTMSSNLGITTPMPKTAALISLVKKYGIAAPTAKKMLKEAELAGKTRPSAITYMLKMAAPFDKKTEMASFKESPMEYTEEVKGGKALDNNTVEDVMKASDAGVKDVMDVSVLKGLATSSRALAQSEEYLPELMVSLDRIGRLLFLLYWHGDSFSERYGDEDRAKLETSLQDVFTRLSDLILFVKSKTSEQDKSSSLVGTELSGDLGFM